MDSNKFSAFLLMLSLNQLNLLVCLLVFCHMLSLVYSNLYPGFKTMNVWNTSWEVAVYYTYEVLNHSADVSLLLNLMKF